MKEEVSIDSVAEIEKEIKALEDRYLISADNIKSEYIREESKRKQYIGRQIFELLQNADDCHDDDHEYVSVKFELAEESGDHILAIKNTGFPFSVCGIRSLLTVNWSPKDEQDDTIGNKGVGFRSVLNWSNEIEIITREFVVSFSENQAKENLKKYRCETRLHPEDLDLIEKNRTAILASPKLETQTERTLHWLENYDTVILLHCYEECLGEIEEQLKDLRFEELLFLKHINRIDIITLDDKRTVESVSDYVADRGCDHVVIHESNKEVLSEWLVWRKDGVVSKRDGKKCNYEMALAYNFSPEERMRIKTEYGCLYSFFKTDVRMPFPYLVHATVDLTEERNNLEKGSEYNERVLDELVEFIADTSVEISKYNDEYDYSALSSMIPGNSDSLYLLNQEYGFRDKLLNKIPHLKILPTINNEYISFDDKPIYSEYSINHNASVIYFADILNKNTFRKLLKICHDETVKEYFASVKIGFYQTNEFDEFMTLIDKDAEEYVETGKHIPLIKLLINKYEKNLTRGNAPKLIVDSAGKRITESDVRIFTNPKDEDLKSLLANLPDWCHMRFLDPKIEDSIDSDSRSLAGKLKSFGCVEYAYGVVMERLIAQSDGDKERICDLLNWLYRRWLNNRNNLGKSFEIKIIDRDGEIKEVSKCYLGEEYGCIYEERITKHLENVAYVAANKVLGIGEMVDTEEDADPRQLVRGFLISLGAKTFPEISGRYLSPNEANSYRNYNSEVYPVLTPQFCNEQFSIKDLSGGTIYVDDIVGLNKILENADFADILYWMLSDDSFHRHLVSKTELPDSYMTWVPPYKQKSRNFNHTQMRSWLLKRVSSAAWLPVKSEYEKRTKVSFDECTLLSHNLSPLVEVLSIGDEVYEDLAGRLGKDVKAVKKDIDDLLKSLGVAEKFIDLPKEKIYSVIRSLPENFPDVRDDKKDRETVQGVYSAINQAYGSGDSNYDFKKLTTENIEYNLFSWSGQIMAKKDGCFGYFGVKEVFYDDGRKYCADILNNYPIFQLNRGRTGNDRFRRLFGIRPLDFSVDNVESSVHDLNARFREEYMSLLPYVFARRISNINRENERTRIRNQLLKNEVILSKQTTISYSYDDEKKTGHLKDFESVTDEKGKVVYIKVPEAISDWDTLRNDQDFQRAISDVVIGILDIESDTDCYCLIFSKTAKDNERFFNPQGDDELIRYAKESFKDSDRLSKMFWNTLSGITGTEEDLLRQNNVTILDGFDFLKLGDNSNFSNLGKLRSLFNSLGAEIFAKYNESELAATYGAIDFVEFNRDKFRNLCQKYANKYFMYVAKKCKAEGKKLVAYHKEQEKYNSFTENFTNDSVDFDERTELERCLGIPLGILENEIESQLESVVKSLSDEPKKINSVFSYDTKSKIIDAVQNDDTTIFDDNADKIPVFVPNTFSGSADKHSETPNKKKTSKGGIHRIESDIKNVKNGGRAERLVYEKLKKLLGPSRLVEWKSGLAEEAGAIGKGEGDDSLGYDIRYYDNENAEHFVEVKSISSNNIEFRLSSNEYKFALEHKENYDVWVVLINNGPQKIFRLDKLFALDDSGNSQDNKKFSVEVDNYIIKYMGTTDETE